MEDATGALRGEDKGGQLAPTLLQEAPWPRTEGGRQEPTLMWDGGPL